MDESHVNKHQKHAVEFVVARADPPEALVPAKKALDLVPLLLRLLIVASRVAAVPLRGDDAALAELPGGLPLLRPVHEQSDTLGNPAQP